MSEFVQSNFLELAIRFTDDLFTFNTSREKERERERINGKIFYKRVS